MKESMFKNHDILVSVITLILAFTKIFLMFIPFQDSRISKIYVFIKKEKETKYSLILHKVDGNIFISNELVDK